MPSTSRSPWWGSWRFSGRRGPSCHPRSGSCMDNAPIHTTATVQDYLAAKGEPYLPYPAPVDFSCFQRWSPSWLASPWPMGPSRRSGTGSSARSLRTSSPSPFGGGLSAGKVCLYWRQLCRKITWNKRPWNNNCFQIISPYAFVSDHTSYISIVMHIEVFVSSNNAHSYFIKSVYTCLWTVSLIIRFKN